MSDQIIASKAYTSERPVDLQQNPVGDGPSNGRVTSVESLSESFHPDELLAFGAKQIISLFIPVTICMLFVAVVSSTVEFYAHTDRYLIYTPFHTPNADVGTQAWETIANTLILMSFVIVMTFVLVLLFKYNCYKLIRGWLIVTTFLLLFFISFLFFTQVVRSLGIFVDYITMAFILWNFGVVGMIAIHWRGPLMLQQAYLVFMSAQIALLFLKYLPKWTCWLVLAALAIWDVIAVLAPRGPLRMLVEMAHERQQPLFPALLYSTTAVYIIGTFESASGSSQAQSNNSGAQETPEPDVSCAQPLSRDGQSPVPEDGSDTPDHNKIGLLQSDDPRSSGNTLPHSVRQRITEQRLEPQNSSTVTPQNSNPRAELWREVQVDLREREERGVKLGLGDFVFYSLLIGRATLDGDAVTVVTCYVAILIGMCLTIIVLGITRTALPALPVSIVCGILFYFVTSLVISPFLEVLAVERLFF